MSDTLQPSKEDYEEAAKRFLTIARDTPAAEERVLVQFFLPSDPQQRPDSKLTWAALNLMAEVIPETKKSNRFHDGGKGKASGFILSVEELDRLRGDLRQKYSHVQMAAAEPAGPRRGLGHFISRISGLGR